MTEGSRRMARWVAVSAAVTGGAFFAGWQASDHLSHPDKPVSVLYRDAYDLGEADGARKQEQEDVQALKDAIAANKASAEYTPGSPLYCQLYPDTALCGFIGATGGLTHPPN